MTQGAATDHESPPPRLWTSYLSVLAPFLGIAIIYTFFAVYDLSRDGSFDDFALLFTKDNLKLVAAQTAIVAIAALGMTLVIISGGIDLSPGSSIALTTVVIAVVVRAGAPPVVALAAGLACGAFVGFLNGLAITALRIVPFIVTLGMMGVARGVAKYLGDEQRVTVPVTWLNDLLRLERGAHVPVWKLPIGVVLLVVLAVGVHCILRYSVFGRYVFAIGSNEATARLCGVNVARQKVIIYSAAGFFTGVAGLLQFSQLTVGDPTVAVGRELDIIAGVVIGGASLSGGKGSILGTIIGAFVMGILRNGCDIYQIPTFVQEIFIGVIIIAAVAADQLRRRSR